MNTEIQSKLIIISSPSGAGKTSICRNILKKEKELKMSVSYTTRKKRKMILIYRLMAELMEVILSYPALAKKEQLLP